MILDANLQLLDELSKYKMENEVKKHVCLCMDEVRIKRGLFLTNVSVS